MQKKRGALESLTVELRARGRSVLVRRTIRHIDSLDIVRMRGPVTPATMTVIGNTPLVIILIHRHAVAIHLTIGIVDTPLPLPLLAETAIAAANHAVTFAEITDRTRHNHITTTSNRPTSRSRPYLRE
jgi:hypothetical protein